MKWLLPALWLAMPSVPDDAQAREAYASLRKKIEAAETLSTDFSITVTVRGSEDGSITGSLRMKGDRQWMLSLQSHSTRRADMNLSTTMICNGTRIVGQGLSGNKVLDPKGTAERFHQSLPDCLLLTIFLLEPRGPVPAIEAPKVEEIRDGGTETLGGISARILLYEFTVEKEKVTVKAWVDPAGPRLLKREVSVAQVAVVFSETYATWEINGPIPESAFHYATPVRLAEARAKQLARSVTLYGTFTGRSPATLEDLVQRPKEVPESVYWPAGGFVLGGVLPKDPWGRSYRLVRENGRLTISCLGADGKPGGTGDDADVSAEAGISPRMAVTAPTLRLRNQYDARVGVQLIGAAVKAYLDTYGELPRTKADLFQKVDLEAAWPEGGWIPGQTLPRDPWGEEFQFAPDPAYARVYVQDPKARVLSFKQLTEEERTGLERASQPLLTDAEHAQIDALVRQLGDDDQGVRQKAHEELRRYGPVLEGDLAIHIAAEKDLETKSRLEELRRSLPRPVPPWKAELAPLSLGILVDGRPGSLSSNERNGSMTLKTFASAEADFRANDRDLNHVNDFWTADVAGLYTLKNPGGQSIKLIELSAALADGAPAEAGTAAGQIPALRDFGSTKPKAGYWFRAMETTAAQQPPEPLRTDTGGMPAMGKVHHESKFGFCAYPAEYGISGVKTFILNEDNTVFWKDTQGEPVLEWPSDADLAQEWKKLD